MMVEITKIKDTIFEIIKNGKFSIAISIAIVMALLSPYLVTNYSLFTAFKSTCEKYELEFMSGVLVFTFILVYWSIYLLIKYYVKLKSYIKGIIQRRRDQNAMLKFLEALKPLEQMMLREFQIQDKCIAYLNYDDDWVKWLCKKHVIQMIDYPRASLEYSFTTNIQAFQLTELAKETLIDTMINYSEENGEPSKWVMANRPEWVKLLEPKKTQPIRRPTYYR